MAETVFQDIPADEWTNLSALVGLNGRVSNSGNTVLIYVVAVSEPDGDSTEGHRFNQDGMFDYVVDGTENIWITSLKDPGIVAVTPDLAVGILNGAMDIHDADVHSVPVNELFHHHTGIATTLAAPAAKGDTSITVVAGAAFANSNFFQLSTVDAIETTYPEIISGGGTNTFVLDRPLDVAFAAGADVELVETNIATAVGTLAAPVSFKLIPDLDQIWHIVRFLLGLVHNSAADDSRFGSLPALTNGCVLRGFNATTGQFRTFTNWKSNADIKMDMFDLNYTDKAGGGDFGTNGRGSVKIGTGAVPKISGEAGDYLELLIQDDLTVAGELLTFNLKGQGHIEGL